MKKIGILFLTMMVGFISMAQKECGTKFFAPPPSWIFEKSRTNFEMTPISINVFVHIIRNSSGTGNSNESEYIVQKLNQDYIGTNISFHLKGYDYIDSDYFFIQ